VGGFHTEVVDMKVIIEDSITNAKLKYNWTLVRGVFEQFAFDDASVLRLAEWIESIEALGWEIVDLKNAHHPTFVKATAIIRKPKS
jgi:hypothetical protein